MQPRPSKDDYYLNIALDVASRGTCLRRNYGAVIVKMILLLPLVYRPREGPIAVI